MTDAARSILAKLLEEHGLTDESLLFRVAEPKSLAPTGTPGNYRLSANANPTESVIDIYGAGYLVQAEQVGPGLAFAESPTLDWQESVELRSLRKLDAEIQSGVADAVKVEVLLKDILSQGGLMYPVESVEVERAWYFTLPQGSIEVRTTGNYL